MDHYEFTFSQTTSGNFRFYRFGKIIPALAGVAGPYDRALRVFQTHFPGRIPTYQPLTEVFTIDASGKPMRLVAGGYERSYWEGDLLLRETELQARCRDLARLTASYMELVHLIELEKDPRGTSSNIGEWVLANHETRPPDIEPSSIRDMCTTPRHSDAMTYLRANLASGAFGTIWRRRVKN